MPISFKPGLWDRASTKVRPAWRVSVAWILTMCPRYSKQVGQWVELNNSTT
jgi:hypothetical protein